MNILINKTISKKVKEVEEVTNSTTVPYWLSARHCEFCHFDLCSSDQIIAFQYDFGKIGYSHNNCFNRSVTEAQARIEGKL
jgi:hypothetical protein